MCWFITVGIQREGAEALEQLGKGRTPFGVRASVNPFVAALFPESDSRFEVTCGQCSCGLWLSPPREDADGLERRRQKYRRKGWSEAKIERALQSSASARGEPGLTEEERRFREAITELVSRYGSARLFAHFYSGSQDEEFVASGERQWIEPDAFLAGVPLPADTVLEVMRRGQ